MNRTDHEQLCTTTPSTTGEAHQEEGAQLSAVTADFPIPIEVRALGKIIRGAYGTLIALTSLGLFAVTVLAPFMGGEQGLLFWWLLGAVNIGIWAVCFHMGTRLRNGRRSGIYGVCALSVVNIIGAVMASLDPQIKSSALVPLMTNSVLLCAVLFVGYRNWQTFR